ncbi:MAG: ribonuclease HII [Chloroflexi bacterium]|nr:ribonuclease HII [Chloroflexota bacterium]
MLNVPLTPSFAEEKGFEAQGYRLIAGIDEVGCGALAGPLVAAAVILPGRMRGRWTKKVNDSKLVPPATRKVLSQRIQSTAISVGIGTVPHHVVDSQGLTKARRLAMQLAVEHLSTSPECLLIDHLSLPDIRLPQKALIKGDRRCFSIACASIVAKVARDRLMEELDESYPGYGLAKHKGYGTREHLACLHRLGPCPIHRQSFEPVKRSVRNEQA